MIVVLGMVYSAGKGWLLTKFSQTAKGKELLEAALRVAHGGCLWKHTQKSDCGEDLRRYDPWFASSIPLWHYG